jgi:hypothetical protein
MANKFYPLGAQKMLRAQIDFDAHVIKAALVSSGYTFSDTHEFLSDTTGTVIGTPITLANKSTLGGVFDADDLEMGAIASGSTAKALILYRDTGSAATSALIGYYDDITGFPFVTNGGAVNIPWSDGSAKILSLV